jgi:squalene cyclase
MRDRSSLTGLGRRLGLKLEVGRVGGVVEMGFVWGGVETTREGGWLRVGLVVRGHVEIPTAASSLEVRQAKASLAALRSRCQSR